MLGFLKRTEEQFVIKMTHIIHRRDVSKPISDCQAICARKCLIEDIPNMCSSNLAILNGIRNCFFRYYADQIKTAAIP